MRFPRPTLLMLTAIAAAASTVANGFGAVDALQAPPTRLGVALTRDVAAQDAAAAQRTRMLNMREQAARATEERLKADLADRTAAGATTGSKGAEAEAGEQYDSLARIYQAMKPARAAVVFEQLDMDVQMQVARRMRDRSMGMILAAMSPRGAAALSMALARMSAKAVPVSARLAAGAAGAPLAATSPAARAKPAAAPPLPGKPAAG